MAVIATPVSAPLSASVTLSRPPAGGFRLTSADTNVPTAPTGAPASSFTAATTGDATALSTGASLVPVIVTFTVRLTVPPWPSLSVKVKLSTLVSPWARYSTVEAATL